MARHFGADDPREMPVHLFWQNRRMDYDSAIKADISKQNYSVCPRHWYVNATFMCARCYEEFLFSADEQRFWYEELSFYVDSRPQQCHKCRSDIRQLKALRQEYEREIALALKRETSSEVKARLVTVIDALINGGVSLPDQIIERRNTLTKQLERRTHG